MNCREAAKQWVDQAAGSGSGLSPEVKAHLDTCSACAETYAAFLETGRFLRNRGFRHAPPALADRCVQAVADHRKQNQRDMFAEPRRIRVSFAAGPAFLRWGFVVLVFLAGMTAGRLLFQGGLPRFQPMQNRPVLPAADDSRAVRNYLISVQTLFLNLTNLEAGSGEVEEWRMEIGLARQVLERTRWMKDHIQDRDPAMVRLVSEIEWVLQDLIRAAEFDLAYVPEEARQAIASRQLISRIQGVIS